MAKYSVDNIKALGIKDAQKVLDKINGVDFNHYNATSFYEWLENVNPNIVGDFGRYVKAASVLTAASSSNAARSSPQSQLCAPISIFTGVEDQLNPTDSQVSDHTNEKPLPESAQSTSPAY